MALQTSSKEEVYTATTAENVILMSMDRMWNDSLQGQLPDSVITHLALHIAEFPAATQPCSPVEQDEEGRIKLPTFVMRKVVVVVVVDRFYVALFSALEQTHCARM